jgi:uncharacterized protein YndB with AHSA1/START domain
MTLPFALDRTVVIQAAPETVFTFFTDSARWASWWGTGSTIEPREGGRMYIRHPNGIEASGEVIHVSPPREIVFSYGFSSGSPIPPGASRVTIRLDPEGLATRLSLRHEFSEPTVRDEHVQGWRYQLSVFANVVADMVNAEASQIVDTWFEAWAETREQERADMLRRIAVPELSYRDRFGLLDGIADVSPHIAATQRFMPDMQVRRAGNVRHCQGTLLVDWKATSSDGTERASGTSVFTLRADRRIESVVGFWAL